MLLKFFANKKGGSNACVDYLLNERVESGTARVLRGDTQITRVLIDSLTQKQKITAGCLSFSEADIDNKLKEQIMDSFEEALLTKEMQNRYNILWVEHRDKGRLELNFVIPKIDLEANKVFNPYYYKVDFTRMDTWQSMINLTYGFSNPKDKKREQPHTGNFKSQIYKDYEALNQFCIQSAIDGIFTNREDLVAFLKENNIEITRESKDYISVKLPHYKKAHRFKGGIYAKSADYGELREIQKIKQEELRKTTQEYLQNLKSNLERELLLNLNSIKQEMKDYKENLEKEVKQTTQITKQSLEKLGINKIQKQSLKLAFTLGFITALIILAIGKFIQQYY